MDWWFVVLYVSAVLLALVIVSSTPPLASLPEYGCAVSGDAASIHNFPHVHFQGCSYSGDRAGSVKLIGRVASGPLGITYQWVGR